MIIEKFKLLNVNLRMFDGEGGGGSPGASAGGTVASGGQTPPAGNQSTVGGQQSKSDSKPVVIYGKQETPPADTNTGDKGSGAQNPNEGQQGTQLTPEERQSAYAKFKQEYKDLYDAEVQGHIKSRLGKYKGIETQFAQVMPLVDMLSEIHGTTDIPTLINKIQDTSLESLADEAGMTVEQYKKMMDLKMQNKRLEQKLNSEETQKQIDNRVKTWYDEAEQMRGTQDNPGQYPEFDLREWAQNDQFVSLLNAGVGVRAAYEVCNIDKIKATTAKKAEENTVQHIKARGNRPTENGTSQTPGVIIKSNVGSLTKADREEIARRAARGENISF